MPEKLKRTVCIVMVVLTLLCSAPMGETAGLAMKASAAVNLTSAQIKSYVESRVGQGYSANSCLAFVRECFMALGGPASTACCAYKYGNSYIKSTSKDNIPIGADVFFGNRNIKCSSCGNYCGHIGIYVGNGEMVHASGGRVLKSKLTYVSNYRGWGYHGGINIVYGGSSEMTEPVVSMSRSVFHVGERVEFSWAATSPNSDFYQYWVVLDNKTTGNRVFEGSTGLAGDVNANYYGFTVTSTGEYGIGVYAVPYNNKDARQKYYYTTFKVTDTDMITPAITLNKQSFFVGDTVNLSWEKSSSDSDFYQYWVVISNITKDKLIYSGETGESGNVNSNHYSFVLTETGNYRITVYSVPYYNKDVRQKATTKTIEVTKKCIHSFTSKMVTSAYLKSVATCVSPAVYYYKCSNCSEKGTNTYTYGSPLNHTYNSGEITTAATCTADGVKTYTCTSCGKTYTEAVPKTGHKYNSGKITTAATCTAPGKTGGSHCSVCGTIISQPTIVPAKGHTLVTDPAVEPTCSTLGKTEGQHCSVCGTVTVEQKDIPMTEHKEKIEIKAATFASDGSEVKNCTVCGKTISDVKIVKIKSATLTKQTFTYSGKAISPTVIVNDQNGKVLKVGTDYNIAYKNNTLPGQASVIITFKGNYSGTKTLRFNILPGATSKISVKQNTNSIVATWSKVAGATGYNVYLFNGKKLVKKLAVTKTSATFKELSSGTNYTVIVKAYTKSGSVTLSSAVSRKLNTATRPFAPSIVVKTNNNQAKVSWKKVAGANSYTVYYSLKKNGGFKKLSTTKNARVIKNLKPGKTYYFKAVANKKVNNKVVTSPYSKIVTATIKK